MASPLAYPQPVRVIVETPAGSRNKYEMDANTGRIRLDRRMASSLVFPMDYGFIPGTISPDGDPLDALIWGADPTFPGCEIEAEPIAVLLMEDEGGRDDTIVCIPISQRNVAGNSQLPKALRDEVAEFFATYKDLEPHRYCRSLGWGDRDQALELIRQARHDRAINHHRRRHPHGRRN